MSARSKATAKTLADLGEDSLVAKITALLPEGPEVRVGAEDGDDCAVIGGAGAMCWELLKVDALVEHVHFLPGEDPRRVGWKALCRAISDIAAMGGLPGQALITLAAPPSTPVAKVEAIYTGLCEAARLFKVSIVGGETSRSPGPIFLNVALTGWVEREYCTLRSNGCPGDLLFVTGHLGGSLAGKHLDFIPRLTEARWLVSHLQIHAMMDLSDGLGADLPRLAAASECSYELRREQLPLTPGCTVDQALSDGEDYELLFSVDPRAGPPLEKAWKRKFPSLPLTCIGELHAPRKARKTKLLRGYDHFAKR